MVTARTVGKPVRLQGPPKSARRPSPPKPPGRLRLAARRRQARAARAAFPYAAAALTTTVAGLALHQPAVSWLGLGAVLGVAGLRLHEAHGWHRAGGKAAMRRRRKFQGPATRREIRAKLSVRAARERSAVTCPGLHPSEAAVVIGRARGRAIADTWAGSRLVYAPPQTLKTGLTACWAADAPGPLLAFSSRCDQLRHTYAARERLGEVRVLNADGEGGIPADFAWSPVDGCQDPRIAIRRAGDLMAAAPRSSAGDDAWHVDRGAKMLRYLLHSAAVTGASMYEVKAWVHDVLSGEPVSILASRGVPGWAEALESLLAHDGDYLASVVTAAESALGWMDDPLMAAAACPPPGEGIDLREFIKEGTGTIYMIGADRPHGSLAPYFAAFGSEAFEVARSVAEAAGGRLSRPFVIVADEAATIAPLPWHKITAVSSGYGIGVTACVQADSQITSRWGEADAKTIRTNFTVKIIGPGFTDPGELEALSAICGDRDTWHHVRHPDGSKTKQPAAERLYPPERIRLLADWHALVLHRNARPVEAVITPVWDRPGYEPAQPSPALVAARPAIEAPREAVPLPGAPAAPPAIQDAAQPDVLIPATPEEIPCSATTSA